MRANTTIHKNPQGEGFFDLKEYLGKDVLEKTAELYEFLRVPLFRKKDVGVPNVYFNFWEKKNILSANRNKAGRLTFVDFLWIKIVLELKKFGIDPTVLEKLRTGLFKAIEIKGLPAKGEQFKGYVSGLQITKQEKDKILKALLEAEKQGGINTGVAVLELLLLHCIVKRKALAIGVFTDGSYLVIDRENQDRYTPENWELLNNAHYVQISLSKILSDYLKTDVAIQTVPELKLLSLAENKLYEAIKTGEFESITIRFKDKKIKTLEFKKNANVSRKIIDIMSEGSFAEIVVKKHNGEITKIEQNIKINF